MIHGWDSLRTTRFRDDHDLSGGQWLRMSIARALYRDAPVLICDEPTAALDARAEAAVYESLCSLQAGRTVILITDRFASVRHADLIVVMYHGRIVETRTHQQLVTAGGRYSELYELQARSYRDQMLDGGKLNVCPLGLRALSVIAVPGRVRQGVAQCGHPVLPLLGHRRPVGEIGDDVGDHDQLADAA
jgi:ABC-type cobalamin/Fe3+-siderophores transport system ATPase subunit